MSRITFLVAALCCLAVSVAGVRAEDDAVPVVGDQYRTLVQWKDGDDLGRSENEPISLRIRMKRAKLYSFIFWVSRILARLASSSSIAFLAP